MGIEVFGRHEDGTVSLGAAYRVAGYGLEGNAESVAFLEANGIPVKATPGDAWFEILGNVNVGYSIAIEQFAMLTPSGEESPTGLRTIAVLQRGFLKTLKFFPLVKHPSEFGMQQFYLDRDAEYGDLIPASSDVRAWVGEPDVRP